ncbi:peptidase inhibitor family I36 protein [Micromonospora sp. C95]|uniref:peptidase inhibitor family I36 protein n=1 Tax=Micromonospora sp. C95 TaxID=2824882 RepID=UPI001B369593|nr:peptidase inhibitor family I36 protein [Micromonospora sp. C95]MBQ1022814.1 peptidase inhibitor family I36 protein [Micromonospora sp. C95]
MRTRTRLLASTAVAILVVTALANPASASPSLRDPSLASFQGRTIDLSKSWQGAQVCAVLSRSEVRCYATNEQATADLAPRISSTGTTRSAGPIGTFAWNGCDNSWICIWEHASFQGRKLQFNDEYWHDLDEWGFKDQTSSWTNNQGGSWTGCSGSDNGTLGDGAGDNRNMGACTASANLGSYNDRAEHIHG